ncbi:hypothetical protein B0O80DRAFT_121558 [Mortierella sp. GBAus27b]|nr:hypothetical protein B0O80DRAFT_121558 [Mortierella sp. GBAus27b]
MIHRTSLYHRNANPASPLDALATPGQSHLTPGRAIHPLHRTATAHRLHPRPPDSSPPPFWPGCKSLGSWYSPQSYMSHSSCPLWFSCICGSFVKQALAQLSSSAGLFIALQYLVLSLFSHFSHFSLFLFHIDFHFLSCFLSSTLRSAMLIHLLMCVKVSSYQHY